MLRSLFLLLVLSQVRKSLCAASALVAAIAGSGWGAGSSASGMPSVVFAMTIASRSSVLASPPNSLAASWAARPGRYADGIPAARARESASAPMLRTWSTTTRAPGNSAKSESRAFPLLATDLLASTSPSRVATHAQCDDFPTSSPMTISGLLGGAMVVSSNRGPIGSSPCDAHITWPWRPRPAVSYRSFGAASASGGNTPPGPSSGQGQTAIRRRPIGGPSGLARIVGNAPNARHRSSSMAYLRL